MKRMNEDMRNIEEVLEERGFTMYTNDDDNDIIVVWIAKTIDNKYVVVDSDYGCTVWNVLSGYGDMTDDDFAQAVVGDVEDYEALRAKCNIVEVGIMYALGINEYF